MDMTTTVTPVRKGIGAKLNIAVMKYVNAVTPNMTDHRNPNICFVVSAIELSGTNIVWTATRSWRGKPKYLFVH